MRLTTALTLLLLATTPGCRFGMDYSGDESGLRRESIAVEGLPGRRLSYLIEGQPDDPRVIFIHGSPGGSGMYVDYLREPVPGVETIAVDRMGYGESLPHEAVTEFAAHADSLAPLLVERNGLWPILVGHSLGAPIAAWLASEYPDRVGGLILVAGGFDPELEDPRWYNEVASWRVMQVFMAGFLNVSNREILANQAQVVELVDRLERIRCPVIIIHGTADDLVPFASVDFLIDHLADNPEVYVAVLIGNDHSITKKRKLEVREIVAALRDGIRDLVEVQ